VVDGTPVTSPITNLYVNYGDSVTVTVNNIFIGYAIQTSGEYRSTDSDTAGSNPRYIPAPYLSGLPDCSSDGFAAWGYGISPPQTYNGTFNVSFTEVIDATCYGTNNIRDPDISNPLINGGGTDWQINVYINTYTVTITQTVTQTITQTVTQTITQTITPTYTITPTPPTAPTPILTPPVIGNRLVGFRVITPTQTAVYMIGTPRFFWWYIKWVFYQLIKPAGYIIIPLYQ
jgi:hypothetical protein